MNAKAEISKKLRKIIAEVMADLPPDRPPPAAPGARVSGRSPEGGNEVPFTSTRPDRGKPKKKGGKRAA